MITYLLEDAEELNEVTKLVQKMREEKAEKKRYETIKYKIYEALKSLTPVEAKKIIRSINRELELNISNNTTYSDN